MTRLAGECITCKISYPDHYYTDKKDRIYSPCGGDLQQINMVERKCMECLVVTRRPQSGPAYPSVEALMWINRDKTKDEFRKDFGTAFPCYQK